jgi:DNA-binding CsgD family transcriptional regulator
MPGEMGSHRVMLWLALTMTGMLLSIPKVSGQVKNLGTPHIINYPKKVYGAAAQSWSISQDQRGFLYFGNSDGLLEFDGKRWRLYPLPNRYMYRAVHISANGTIYIGLTNDFGIMKPDPSGRLTYESISQRFPRVATSFNDIWKIYETADGLYFQSKNKIFLYHNDTIELISPEKEFNFLYQANKVLYTSERHLGLLRIDGNRLTRMPGGSLFAGKNIETILPFDDTRIVIGTSKNGLYLYDGAKAVPWAPEASAFLKENSIFCGTHINRKFFALGTIRNGILIIDRNGRPVQHINQRNGLQNNTVLSMMADRDNNLWLGLDQGISFIETNSPISYYSYGESLPGTGYCSILSDGMLYAGTNQGLFGKKWTAYEDPLADEGAFTPVPGTQGQVWSLRQIGNTLFCGHNNGTYLIRGNRADLISDIPGGWDYLQMEKYPGTVIGGTYTGISIYKPSGRSWTFDRTLSGFSESSRTFAEDGDGSIWVAHGGLGIFRIVPDEDLNSVRQVRVYNESDGLPSRYRNSLAKIDNRILFPTISGVYQYNKMTDTFEPDPVYTALIGSAPVSSLIEDPAGNVWFFRPEEFGVIRTAGGSARIVETRPFNPILKLINHGYESVTVIDETNILIACEKGFAHYDPSFPYRFPERPICYIRSLTGSGVDSTATFFGGTFTDPKGKRVETQDKANPIRIPYAMNNLRIDFAVPIYDDPEEIRFSYILEGYDEGWSAWSSTGSKEYTRLPEGDYLFRVKGKNVYNIETPDSLIRFRVLPPWYRSIMAYVFYSLVLLVAAWLFVRSVIRKIRRDKALLTLQHERDITKAREQHMAESMEAEKKLVLLEKEKLEAEMSHKNKQLANSVSELLKKNEFLIQLKTDMEKLKEKSVHPAVGDKVKNMIASVDDILEADNDYDQFEAHFDAVHDDFLKTLKKQYPQLTPKDLRLCAYLRMNLTTKEIAPLLNITPRGVEISRYRLRKKMNLPHDANLSELMMSI